MNRDTIVAIARDHRVQLGAASVVSIALGGLGGYEFAKRKLRTHYEEIANEEIAEAKRFYSAIHKHDSPTPQDAVKERIPVASEFEEEATIAFSHYKGEAPAETEEELVVLDERTTVFARSTDTEIEVKSRNVFEDEDEPENYSGWDYETELARRSGDTPYVITEQEFLQGDKDYEQISMTYFEGDDVLSDDKDTPVPDPDSTVGEGNLSRFGQGTNNPNMVHIRNDKIEADFEILRSNGSYAAEVHGFIEHSYDYTQGVRKFRRSDD